MKVYTLTIVYDENDDTIEYIEEEVTEDVSTAIYNVEVERGHNCRELIQPSGLCNLRLRLLYLLISKSDEIIQGK